MICHVSPLSSDQSFFWRLPDTSEIGYCVKSKRSNPGSAVIQSPPKSGKSVWSICPPWKNAASFGYCTRPEKTVIILLFFANLHSCRYLYMAFINDFFIGMPYPGGILLFICHLRVPKALSVYLPTGSIALQRSGGAFMKAMYRWFL